MAKRTASKAKGKNGNRPKHEDRDMIDKPLNPESPEDFAVGYDYRYG